MLQFEDFAARSHWATPPFSSRHVFLHRGHKNDTKTSKDLQSCKKKKKNLFKNLHISKMGTWTAFNLDSNSYYAHGRMPLRFSPRWRPAGAKSTRVVIEKFILESVGFFLCFFHLTLTQILNEPWPKRRGQTLISYLHLWTRLISLTTYVLSVKYCDPRKRPPSSCAGGGAVTPTFFLLLRSAPIQVQMVNLNCLWEYLKKRF